MSKAIVDFLTEMYGSDIESLPIPKRYTEYGHQKDSAYASEMDFTTFDLPTWSIEIQMGFTSSGDVNHYTVEFEGSTENFMRFLKKHNKDMWDAVKEAEKSGELEEYE